MWVCRVASIPSIHSSCKCTTVWHRQGWLTGNCPCHLQWRSPFFPVCMLVLFLWLHYCLNGIWATEYFLEGPVMGSNKDSPLPPPQAHLQENPISYKSRVQDSAGPWSKWPKPKTQTEKHLWITKSQCILLKNSSVHLERVWYIKFLIFKGVLKLPSFL